MSLTKQRSTLITYLRDHHGSSFGDTTDDRIVRALDNALRMLRAFEWRFLMQTAAVETIAEYATGTAALPDPLTDKLIDFSGATLPANIVTENAFLELDGEHKWYEIVVRNGDTQLTMRSKYTGSNAVLTSGLSYRIVYPLIALPANFRRMEAVWDSARACPITEVEVREAWWLNAGQAGGSEPLAYAIVQKRNDPNTKQLLLWPPGGSSTYAYELVYLRHPGWFNSATVATATWSREAAADTDYLDWPDEHMDLYYAAARVCMYREHDPFKRREGAEMEYYDLLQACQGDDKRSNVMRTLGDGSPIAMRPESQWVMPGPGA